MSNKTANVLVAKPVREEVISAAKYAKMTEKEKAAVKESEIVPPRLGGKGFGGILVRYKTPVYRVG